MDLHAHVTIPHPLKYVPFGWKKTEIVLEKGNKVQTDLMLTKHYRIGVRGIDSFQDIIEDAKHVFDKVFIHRLKIEQDSDFFLPINKKHYVEFHALVPDTVPILGGWVRSRNPKSIIDGQRRFFLNKRVYSSKLSVKKLADNVRNKLKDKQIPFIDFRVEQVVFDSNKALDGWWA